MVLRALLVASCATSGFCFFVFLGKGVGVWLTKEGRNVPAALCYSSAARVEATIRTEIKSKVPRCLWERLERGLCRRTCFRHGVGVGGGI